MAQYISKDTLVAELKARINDIEISQKAGLIKKRDADKKILLFKSVLSLINTLEIKEMNLEKEYNDFQDLTLVRLVNRNAGIVIAEHFFELGLKTQKGE